jgi:hypothetical protein
MRLLYKKASIALAIIMATLLLLWPTPSANLLADIQGADVVIGLSFGVTPKGPGKSNIALGHIAKKLNKTRNIPLILQWEISDTIPTVKKVGIITSNPNEYLDSYEVLRQSKVICDANGWKTAVILAHPDHLWRCKKIAEKMGVEVLIVDTSNVPYDSASTEVWTKNRFVFLPREILACALYFIRGWI